MGLEFRTSSFVLRLPTVLVDRAIIHVQGGNGGDGCVSFRREAYVPKGGPDGGDGGDGGSVILRATAGVDTLLDMAGRHHWRAESGRPGMGKSRYGRSGEDLIVQVPPGTLIYDDETGELIDDLDTSGKTLLVARGGRGGYGNEHYKSATNQAPREAQSGGHGEERRLRLELKLIADIGFVGKPNAGKSTLLARLTHARPKIADYPFTTLEPNLGIAELGDERRLVLADIPGLIEGASAGAGLGHEFLRHIERTRLLVHVIEHDATDRSDPIDNYHAIRRELAEYAEALGRRKEIIVLNKMDLLPTEDDRRTAVQLVEAELGSRVLPISAVTGEGCRELLERCWRYLRTDDIGA